MSKNFIYGLVHPLTKELRYVGLSSRGMETPRRHKHQKSGGTHKNNWVNSLKSEGLMYEIVILSTLSLFKTKEETIAALRLEEKRIIAEERAKGTNLVNETDGGEGTFGYVQSPEQKEKQAEYMRNRAKSGPTAIMLETCYKKKEHRITDGVTEKHCSRCDSWKQLGDFSNKKDMRDGLQSYCRTCAVETLEPYRPQPLPENEFKATYDQNSPRIQKIKATKAANPQEKTAAKPYSCFKDGDLVKTFPSITEAVKQGYATSSAGVANAVKRGGTNNGYTWKKA